MKFPWLKKLETKASKAGKLISMGVLGQPVWTPRQYDKLAEESYAKNAVAYRAINEISKCGGSVPFNLFKGTGDSRKEVEVSPLLDLLNRPNPVQGRSAFIQAVIGYLLISGNSYLEMVGPSFTRPPRELWTKRPDRMQVVAGKTGIPSGYVFTNGGQSVKWPANQITGRSKILQIKTFHPLNDWYGMCYSDDTEILTKDKGWLRFKELSKTDLVATRNTENSVFQWQTPTAIIAHQYEGDICHFQSRCIDLLVTPEHRMLIRTPTKKEHILTAAALAVKPLLDGHYKIPMTSTWISGVEVPNMIFSYVASNGDWTFKISGDDYCALLGAYISEGNLRKLGGIEINQTRKSKAYKLYSDLIVRINGRTGYNGKAFIIARRSLTKHFSQFGLSSDKFVPELIRNAPKRQIQIFWDYYMASDGCSQTTMNSTGKGNHPTTKQEAITTSPVLADHLVELAQKLGYSASVACRAGGLRKVIDRICHVKDSYHIRVRYSSHAAATSCSVPTYKGNVYCVSVPNGIVFVRRNGKTAWCGNSPVEAAAFSVDQHNEAGAWNMALLQNSARPSGALVVDPKSGTGLDDDQFNTLKEQIKAQTGPDHAGEVLLLEGGLDWKEMGLSPVDMAWIEGKHTSARDIAMVFGMPAQMLGIPGDNTHRNMEEARLWLWEQTIIPLLSFLLQELNWWLTPLFGDDLELVFDLDEVPALISRRHTLWDKVTTSDFLTINEKREAVGYEPRSEGDVIRTPSKNVDLGSEPEPIKPNGKDKSKDALKAEGQE